MAPPDASRGTRIPSLAWESVVDDAPAETSPGSAAPGDVPAPSPDSPATPAGPATPVVEPLRFETSALAPSPSEPISFAPMELSTRPVTPTAPEAPIADVSIPPLGISIPVLGDLGSVEAPAPRPDAASDPRPSGRAPTVTPRPDASAAVASATAPPVVAARPATAPPAAAPVSQESPAAAPSANATPTPSATPDASPAAADPTAAERTDGDRPSGRTSITPSAPSGGVMPMAGAAPESAAAPSSAAAESVDPLPAIREATPVPTPAPVPAAPSPALPQVPSAPARPAAVHSPVDSTVAPVAATTRQRQRPRRGLMLVFTVVVLSAVVAAAVVYGPRYLFPGDWDEAARPYAEAVEAVRGVEIAEPVAVTAEPTSAYDARAAAELTGDWNSLQPEWRALGLLSGPVTAATIADQLAGWTQAEYSTTDGQVYHDAALVGADLDSSLTEAMTAAALDQEFGWSPGQPERPLDDAALVDAEVIRQSRAIRAASEFSIAVAESSPEKLAALPPVLGYRALAPAMFAEFALTAQAGDPLEVVGSTAPLRIDAGTLAPVPTMIGSDKVLTSPRVEDRSFWFLVFAAYLDSSTAYSASEAIVENSVTIAQRTATQCVYATFAGGDVDQTAQVRGALEQWVAAAPAELSASFAVLPDGTLQLSSCDPGSGFEQPVRTGTVTELLAWRSAELATSEGVRAGGGGAAEFDEAWSVVEQSPAGVGLGTLPASTSPADFAEAARWAVTGVFFPPD